MDINADYIPGTAQAADEIEKGKKTKLLQEEAMATKEMKIEVAQMEVEVRREALERLKEKYEKKASTPPQPQGKKGGK